MKTKTAIWHTFSISIGILLLTSCWSVKEFGKVNMISNRNIDPHAQYVNLKSYANQNFSAMKKTRSNNIEGAIDNTVMSVPGGEYLMNVKMYQIVRSGLFVQKTWFAVDGDVYGIPQNIKTNADRFKVGDKVQWTSMFKVYKGKITEMVDQDKCTVKEDVSGTLKQVKFIDLKKDLE